MASNLLTVEQVAQQLKLHPKTVLRYIKEERLRATRIGKAYRISQADLNAFAGLEGKRDQAGTGARATCVVDLPGTSMEGAQHIANFLGAAAMSGSGTLPPLHFRTVYDPETSILKVVAIGEPGDVAKVLEVLQAQPRQKQ